MHLDSNSCQPLGTECLQTPGKFLFVCMRVCMTMGVFVVCVLACVCVSARVCLSTWVCCCVFACVCESL